MKHPKVTVLMPVYNGEKYLKQAIDSILSQTFSDFEFLIIDDGCIDGSVSIINSYTDKRIKLVHNGKNRGLIVSLNKGIEMASGDYIARMDCDDISHPQRFEMQVEYLDKHPTVCLVAAHMVIIDENGNEVGYWREDMSTKSISQIRSMLPKENCIAHPTVMMRRDIVKSIGYKKSLVLSEDWGLWLSLLSEGHIIAKLDTLLLKYRVHPEGSTVKANREGVRKKIIRFKFRYIKYKLQTLNFKGTDYKVLASLIKDVVRYLFTSLRQVL